MTIGQCAGITSGVVVAIATLTHVCITPYNRPSGGVIQGQAEPLRTWEVFFWTSR